MAKTKTTKVTGTNVTKKGLDSTKTLDVMKVYGASNTVYARKGNDTITVYKGGGHHIYGDDGNDIIEVKEGLLQSVWGGKGNDTITITGGDYYYVFGEAGNDTIYIEAGVMNLVQGGAGNDTIYVRGQATGNPYSGGTAGGVQGGAGNDKIYIEAGAQHSVRTGSGNDTISLTGGSNHYVFLEKGTNTVKVSAADVKLQQASKMATDKITVNWSKDIGTLQIYTVKNSSKKYKDSLIIKGLKSSDAFIGFTGHTNDNLSIAAYSTTNGIDIMEWKNNKSFSGIKFDDKTLSFAAINKKAQ